MFVDKLQMTTLFAILAYCWTYINISRENFEDSDLGLELFNSSKKVTIFSIVLSCTGFIYCLVAYLLIRYYPNFIDNKIYLLIFCIFLLIYVMKQHNWFVNLYKKF
jgi:hypothetical protein